MTDNLERALQERLLARSQVSPRDVEALRLFARTLPARRSFWRRPAMQWALSAAAVVLAAVVALPLIFRAPGFGTESPAPSSPVPTAPVVVVPTNPPTPATPSATPTPSLGAGTVRLLTASGSDVTIVIDDPDGLIQGAESGQGEATMSVRWYEAMVEDGPTPNSVRLTWVGFPRDEVVRAQVSRSQDGHLVLHIEQDNPPLNSDGLGEDRVLILELSDGIDRADFQVTFEITE